MKKGPEDITKLVEEVIRDHSKLRNIISLLYDEDMSRRFMAAKALGEIARLEPELMKQGSASSGPSMTS